MRIGVMLAMAFSTAACSDYDNINFTQASGPKHQICTDTRDGEKFSFDVANAYDADIGFTASSYSVKDDNGQVRTITTEATNSWLKCVGAPNSPVGYYLIRRIR